jgi:hypothetical protein
LITKKSLAIIMTAVTVGLLSMLGFGLVAAQTPDASRSLPPESVAPGGEVVVTITADNYGQAGGVTETLPSMDAPEPEPEPTPGDEQGQDPSASRSIPPASVAPGGRVVVTITADNYGQGSHTFPAASTPRRSQRPRSRSLTRKSDSPCKGRLHSRTQLPPQ